MNLATDLRRRVVANNEPEFLANCLERRAHIAKSFRLKSLTVKKWSDWHCRFPSLGRERDQSQTSTPGAEPFHRMIPLTGELSVKRRTAANWMLLPAN